MAACWWPATLGYALSVKNLYTMNVEYYTGIDERLDVPMILPPTPELVDLTEARVLVADDVADTGHTLALVKDFCVGKVSRGALRGALREAPLGREVRVRLARDRQVDRVPVEHPGADRLAAGWISGGTCLRGALAPREPVHRQPRRITVAALRPLAPHTPAPG